MTPSRAAAWARWHASGVDILQPTAVLDALLDEYERTAALTAAVRAFVLAEEDSTDRILAFAALVKLVNQ